MAEEWRDKREAVKRDDGADAPSVHASSIFRERSGKAAHQDGLTVHAR
jgi:hypothetical protein